MTYRGLRYVWIAPCDVDEASSFANGMLGLQAAGTADGCAYFRSDMRGFSLGLSGHGGDAIGLTVASERDLDQIAERLEGEKIAHSGLSGDRCALRKVKKGLSVTAPNGVAVEVVWRPLTSGWRYHGPRDAGITELLSVSLCCSDVAADERFWTEILGCRVADWAGDACYIALDDFHHRIALYPSKRGGLLGVSFAVEGFDQVMQNFYFLQKQQLPIIHGPGLQTASGARFVTTRGPRDVLFSFASDMARGAALADQPPRQFAAHASSHCAWGSATLQPEFLAED